MPKFLAIYTGTATAAEKAQAEGRIDEAAGMAAWGEWMARHKENIVDPGGPLGKTKKASPAGIGDIVNTAAAYVIVEAETHETAAEMFRDHPHFTHFPGEGIDIMPILEVPGMDT